MKRKVFVVLSFLLVFSAGNSYARFKSPPAPVLGVCGELCISCHPKPRVKRVAPKLVEGVCGYVCNDCHNKRESWRIPKPVRGICMGECISCHPRPTRRHFRRQ